MTRILEHFENKLKCNTKGRTLLANQVKGKKMSAQFSDLTQILGSSAYPSNIIQNKHNHFALTTRLNQAIYHTMHIRDHIGQGLKYWNCQIGID